MQTQVLFVVYRTSMLQDKKVFENVLEFSLDKEVADKAAEIRRNEGYSCEVVKELAVTQDQTMYIVKNEESLNLSKAKQLKDFKDHVLGNMSSFDKRVLLASKNLTIQ